MLLKDFTKSTHADFPGLKSIEFHDGGKSFYGFGHNITTDPNEHARLRGGKQVTNPADAGFTMALSVFASAMDFAEITSYAEKIVGDYNMDSYESHKTLRENAKWYGGFRKVTDGYDMICSGWQDGADRAQLGLGKIQIPEVDGIESMRRTLIFSDYGETLNIDQAMSGNWEKAWQTCKRIASGVSRVISLVIPFGGNCDKNSEQLFWNGAAGMIITDMLEDKGYRVQLYGVHAATQRADGQQWDVDIVRLKNSDEPVRMDSIAAVVAHAGVFRTAGFMSILAKPIQADWGLGCCQEAELRKVITGVSMLGHMHPDTIVLEPSYTQEQAEENVKQFFEDMKNGKHRAISQE